jgi:hypothetical protein
MGNTNHRALRHIFNIAWKNILSTGKDHVLDAVNDIKKTIIIQLADITSPKPFSPP